ncbi:hypothetical protein M5K25_021921 [Dendrobium thyrsiflorum]|uniref:DUF4283 domain-containing protein n=1 Tax=Dendrobium thyrsiflorum TaxID=117978 RepID=A0ABD0UB01_DENTH
MDASTSTAWGKASSPIGGKNKGFLSLEVEGKSPSKSRSFKDVLSGNDSVGDLSILAQSVFNGVPAVLLSDEEVLKLASPFQFTLVGKFSLRRPNLDMIRQFFGNLKLTGFFSIGLLDARHVSIQLTNDLDYSRVFARRSYFVNNCQMRILKWTPFFDIRQESPIVPIWISFPNLRLHFFNPKVLHALGSLFGRPLQTDQVTAARTRPSVARVLVEVDITKKHAKEVWVGSKAYGYLQKVEFENIPDFCSHCKMHGHASTVCFKLHPGLKNAPKPTEEEDVPSCEIGLPVGKIDNSDQFRNVEQTPSHVVQGIASASDAECVKVNVPVSNDIAPSSITVPTDVEKSTEFFISIDSMLQNNASTCPTVPNEIQSPASTPSTDVGKIVQTEVGEPREEGEFIPNEVGDRENSVDNLNVSSSNPNLINMPDDPHNQKKNDEVPFTMELVELDRVSSEHFWRGGAYSFHFAEVFSFLMFWVPFFSHLKQQEMNSWMKTGTMLLLLLLLLLLTMTVCGVATTRMAMIHGTSEELHIHLMKKVSLEGGKDDENENGRPSYPEASVDNHHKIPRTQFDSSGPSGADDGGNEGDDNKN